MSVICFNMFFLLFKRNVFTCFSGKNTEIFYILLIYNALQVIEHQAAYFFLIPVVRFFHSLVIE